MNGASRRSAVPLVPQLDELRRLGFTLRALLDSRTIFGMEDRFDPAKDATNREKHKLSLAFGDRIFEDGDHLIIQSFREIDGEERFKAVGLVDGKLFTGVFTWRDDLPRFISVRRSNRGEERSYHSAG